MERRRGAGPASNDSASVLARAPEPRGESGRRLQRMGTVTVGVSLPRDWVGHHRLTVGSLVYLDTLADGSLVVRDRLDPEETRVATIKVRVDRPGEHLFRQLIAAYLDGAQEFHVLEPSGLSAETVATARGFARRTVQPEIVTEEADRLLLRDVSRGRDLHLVPLLRRMHQIVLRLHEEAAATFVEGAAAAPGDWPSRDEEVDRQAWLIERILSLNAASPAAASEVPLGSILQVLLVVRALERTADHAVLIAEHGAQWTETSPPDRLVRTVADFHGAARRLCAGAFAAALRGDADAANDLIDTGEALHAQHHTLIESSLSRPASSGLPDAGRVELALLLQSIDRTVAYSQDIAEAGLDTGVRRQIGPASPVPSPSSTAVVRGGTRTT